MRVLVSAAGRHGATEEIAAAIGRALVEGGLDADVRPVERVLDVEPYDAVVLGSAIYYGKWVEPARRFLERHAGELSARPVWLFSSGPLGDPLRPAEGQPVDAAELVAAVGAREHRLFAGRLERGRLGLRERAVVRAVGAAEGDFRDWAAIAEWAAGISATLRAERPG
jgi:menaquinone-dependent protoporphyrinogen oxidase